MVQRSFRAIGEPVITTMGDEVGYSGHLSGLPRSSLHYSRIADELEFDDDDSNEMTLEARVGGGMGDNDASFLITSMADQQDTVFGYPGVRAFMTDSKDGQFQMHWVDMKVQGTLNLAIQGQIEGLPLVTLQLIADGKGGQGDELLSYEVPLNFTHDFGQSSTFYAIGIMKGHFLGFSFENPIDKEAFSKLMNNIQKRLLRSRA